MWPTDSFVTGIIEEIKWIIRIENELEWFSSRAQLTMNRKQRDRRYEDMQRNRDGQRENNVWVEILEKYRTEQNGT